VKRPKDRRESRAERAAIEKLERRITAHGFSLEYREFVEDAAMPGVLGYYRGRTSHERREVLIATRWAGEAGNPTIREALAHELRHVEDPAWDCGSRPVFYAPISRD
jgi:hypothetical protein